MADQRSPSLDQTVEILGLSFDKADWTIVVHANIALLLSLLALAAVGVVVFRRAIWRRVQELEINEAELAVGSGRLTLRPNVIDRQVAFEILVELSTRKIGLRIDPEHDVISEIYDSWHAFFGITRDLVKSIPVTRLSAESTQQIVNLSIEVLNKGIRPHLTKYQARFRGWMEAQEQPGEDPQQTQKRYPAYAELEADLLRVNHALIAYRGAMHQIVYGRPAAAEEAVAEAVEAVEDVAAESTTNERPLTGVRQSHRKD